MGRRSEAGAPINRSPAKSANGRSGSYPVNRTGAAMDVTKWLNPSDTQLAGSVHERAIETKLTGGTAEGGSHRLMIVDHCRLVTAIDRV